MSEPVSEPLTDEDRTAAAKSLRQWFMSQSISPGDAAPIMMQLIAELMVEKTTDLSDLNDGMVMHQQILAMFIAKALS